MFHWRKYQFNYCASCHLKLGVRYIGKLFFKLARLDIDVDYYKKSYTRRSTESANYVKWGLERNRQRKLFE